MLADAVGAGGGYASGGGRTARPGKEPPPSVTSAFGVDRQGRGGGGGANAGDSGGHAGTSGRLAVEAGAPSGPKPAAGREDARQQAAFASIQRLRTQQNVELQAAVQAEQIAEAGRVELLGKNSEGADRVRLQKLLKLERDRADAELRGLTAEHELALAELFKKLKVTR